ncbi:MAG: class I SAM-dependent methyltransferase [Legionellales bacterium]|nr:class I SAM-dependent methyltransferase [Legionellales bacterium]
MENSNIAELISLSARLNQMDARVSTLITKITQQLSHLLQHDCSTHPIDKSTITLIALEIFYMYSSRPENYQVYDVLLVFRKNAWKTNYGVPTIEFLLSYEEVLTQIENIPLELAENILHYINTKPTQIDELNRIKYYLHILKRPIPQPEEEGHFVKTFNSQGYMTTRLDTFSKKFIAFCQKQSLTNKEFSVLEIGAAFGIATLAALEAAPNATVYCNDLDPHQLQVVQYTAIEKQIDANLILLPGRFPNELSFESGKFQAILICRVLHFSRGNDIIVALKEIKKWLAPDGKLFVIVETPFIKAWISFLPEFIERKAKDVPFPGEIDTPMKYAKDRAPFLPPFIHFMDIDGLSYTLAQAGFEIEQIAYIDRKNQFPSDILLDGRESVGAVAT